MTLKEWLADRGITEGQFAQAIGTSREAVRRYVRGERIPSRELMPVIAQATDNAVLPTDFWPEIAA